MDDSLFQHILRTDGALSVPATVDELVSVYVRSKRAARNPATQVAAEEWIRNLLRHLWATHRNAFTDEHSRLIRQAKENHERVKPLGLGSLPKDGDHLLIRRGVIRVHVDGNKFQWSGEGINRFPYGADRLKSDLTEHFRYLVQLDKLIDSIDPSQPVEDAWALVMDAARRELVIRFDAMREKLGLEKAILMESSKTKHRVTHCYSCKKPLESGLFFECASCHWLVCGCGACGCGYNGDYQ